MKYNEKYDVYLDDDLVIYYYRINGKGKFVQRSISKNKDGYYVVQTKIGKKGVHRVIYETFVGEIPEGYEIDHINTIRTDNRLENLRCVTHEENMNNPISLKNRKEFLKGNTNYKGNIGKTHSDFGKKFKEHYGITRTDNIALYLKEYHWYQRHKKCRWE